MAVLFVWSNKRTLCIQCLGVARLSIKPRGSRSWSVLLWGYSHWRRTLSGWLRHGPGQLGPGDLPIRIRFRWDREKVKQQTGEVINHSWYSCSKSASSIGMGFVSWWQATHFEMSMVTVDSSSVSDWHSLSEKVKWVQIEGKISHSSVTNNQHYGDCRKNHRCHHLNVQVCSQS